MKEIHLYPTPENEPGEQYIKYRGKVYWTDGKVVKLTPYKESPVVSYEVNPSEMKIKWLK